jgi:hypothetical protein
MSSSSELVLLVLAAAGVVALDRDDYLLAASGKCIDNTDCQSCLTQSGWGIILFIINHN